MEEVARHHDHLEGGAAHVHASGGAQTSLGEKRVGNSRIKAELGVRLHYPTYREGLQAIVIGPKLPFPSRADGGGSQEAEGGNGASSAACAVSPRM